MDVRVAKNAVPGIYTQRSAKIPRATYKFYEILRVGIVFSITSSFVLSFTSKLRTEGARNVYPIQLHIFSSVTYIFGVLKPVTYIEFHRFPD